MNIEQMMDKISSILDDSKTGVLATVNNNGQPHMRWMTPSVLKEWPHSLLAVTAPSYPKINDLSLGNKIEWMLQTKALDQIVNIKGTINVVDNPSLKAQVMEAMGSKLRIFWNVNSKTTDFVILETTIEEATYFCPMKAIKETVFFNEKGV